MSGLTEKQAVLLAFLTDYDAGRGIAPTIVEMRQAVGVASSSGIVRMLVGLEERGFIRRIKHRARAIEIIKAGVQRPTAAILASYTDEALHELRRDLAMEITKRTNDIAIKRVDAIMAGEGA